MVKEKPTSWKLSLFYVCGKMEQGQIIFGIKNNHIDMTLKLYLYLNLK